MGAGSTTGIIVSQAVATANLFIASGQGTMDGANFVSGDVIGMKLFRDANASESSASDSFTGKAELIFVKVDFLCDRLGE